MKTFFCVRRGKGGLWRVAVLIVALSLLFIGTGAVQAQDGTPISPPPLPGGRESPLRFMVPHPQVLEQVSLPTLMAEFPSLDPEQSFSPGPRMPLPTLQQEGGAAVPMAGPASPFRTLAILVKFGDNPNQPSIPTTQFDTLLFGTAGATMRAYYREVSYLQLDIVTLNLPSTLGWQTAPQPYSYYVNGQYCFGSYPRNCQKLAEDAVNLVDSVVDFSQYDNNSDGWVDTVFIIHAGQGAEFTGNPNHIWSHSWWTQNYPRLDGVWIGSYTTEPEYWQTAGDMTHGVYAHELGHAFGLPDLYDTDGSSEGIGAWSLMSSGSWNGTLGNSPAHLDAWSRLYLGFTTATVLTPANQLINLPNVEQNASGAIYRLNTGFAGEYFLLENRQQVGSDASLPGAGLLIWHVDDQRSNNRKECLSVNNWLCGTSHFKVALEQADGLLELEKKIDWGDAGDPFPGTTGNTAFDSFTNPNTSSYYTSSAMPFAVVNISSSASTMTARIAGPPAVPTLISPADGGTINTSAPLFQWADDGFTATYKLVVKKPSGVIIFKQTFAAASICGGGTCSVTGPTNLKDGKTYTWKVVAQNAYGKVKSAKWTFMVDLP